jgi:phage head maturation protease
MSSTRNLIFRESHATVELITRETDSPVVGVDTETRRVTVRLCRWNEPREVNDGPGARYREAYPPGSLELAPDVHVVDRHRGDLIGRADPATFTNGADGPTVQLVLARTAAGNDTLALIEAGVIRAVSMELEPIAHRDAGGVVWRERSRVHGVAFAFRPAHDAPILATREDERTETNADTLTREQVDAMLAGMVTREAFDQALDDVRRDALADQSRGDTGHPAARFRSLVEYADHLFTAEPASVEVLTRALADQTTVNNPGVVPPAWLTSVAGIIDQSRPTITAFGTGTLPASGMEIDWPYFDGDLTALVAAQVAEKTAIVSVRVDLKKGSQPIVTYAGGSDISYQLIRRSSPAYRDAYLRIMLNAYALVTNAAAATAATTAAVDSAGVWPPTTGTLAELATALFTASVEVQVATGSPATFALAASDVFIAAGGMAVEQAAPYGNMNVAGTASAASLQVSVAGLPVIHDPALVAGTLLVSNGASADWFEDGPFTVTAEDVEKLGQNVAVWGMGAFATFLPNGVRQVLAVAPIADSASRSKK